jgi:hypothetical protein
MPTHASRWELVLPGAFVLLIAMAAVKMYRSGKTRELPAQGPELGGRERFCARL